MSKKLLASAMFLLDGLLIAKHFKVAPMEL